MTILAPGLALIAGLLAAVAFYREWGTSTDRKRREGFQNAFLGHSVKSQLANTVLLTIVHLEYRIMRSKNFDEMLGYSQELRDIIKSTNVFAEEDEVIERISYFDSDFQDKLEEFVEYSANYRKMVAEFHEENDKEFGKSLKSYREVNVSIEKIERWNIRLLSFSQIFALIGLTVEIFTH